MLCVSGSEVKTPIVDIRIGSNEVYGAVSVFNEDNEVAEVHRPAPARQPQPRHFLSSDSLTIKHLALKSILNKQEPISLELW